MIRSDIVQQLEIDGDPETIPERLCHGCFSSIASGAFACDSEFQSFGVIDSLKYPPSFAFPR